MDSVKLNDACPGRAYVIQKIDDEARLVNRLSSMGIFEGTRVEICQNYKNQPVLLFARDTLAAIGREECGKIMIGGEADE